MRTNWKLLGIMAVVAIAGAWLLLDHRAWARINLAWSQLASPSLRAGEARAGKEWTEEPAKASADPLGTLTLSRKQI